MNLRTLWRAIAFAAALLPAYATAQPAAAPAAASRYAVIPPNKDTDLKLYEANGNVVAGAAALGRMQKDAQLILWLAGNQFFAMDEVVHAFQKQAPGTTVGLVTLPPGLLLEAIEKGGWTYGGVEYPGLPDVYEQPEQFNTEDLQRPSEAAKRAAVAMFHCFEETRVREAMAAAQVAFQNNAIEENPEAFAHIRAELDDVIRRATEVVAEGDER